jgi:hypothetical protein
MRQIAPSATGGYGMRAAAALALLVLAFAASGCKLRSVDEGNYAALNEAAIRDVPTYPGARLVSSENIGDRQGNGWPAEDSPGSGPYTSFRTEKVYVLPPGLPPRRVLAFYDKALRDHWGPAGYSGDGGSDRSFRKGTASLYMWIARNRLYFTVDHGAYG